MSPTGGTPVPAAFEQARAAVDRHLDAVLAGRDLGSVGWERPDPLTLYIPLRGFTSETTMPSYGFDPASPTPDELPSFPGSPPGDDYLLRLHFSYYPEWPPSTRFVNPDTRQFGPGDVRWLPKISTNELAVHPNYGNSSGQVICCSATLEFYLVNHGVADHHRWQPGSSFAITLNVLSRYLRPPTYTGRQG